MKKKKKGVTLIELVVVIALVTIVGGMIMTLFLSQNKSMNYVKNSTALQDEARIILSTLENDIRVAKNRDFSVRTEGDREMIYSYEVDSSNRFAYYYDTTKKSVVKAKHNGTSYDDIVSISDSVESIIIIEDTSITGSNKVYSIEINMKKNEEELPFKTKVALRN